MTTRRPQKFVWATWLAKLMVGETTCEWATWFRSTYEGWTRQPSDSDNSAYLTAHTRLLRGVVQRRRELGERVLVERQAAYRYRRPFGLVLAGVPDAVPVMGSGGTVIDVKTGQHRASHAVQVKIGMYCLPRALPAFRDIELAGQVIYEDGQQTNLAPETARGEFEDHLNYFLDVLDAGTPPPRNPSRFECRFCDIGPADCPERVSR